MKTAISIIALAVAISALAMTIYTRKNPQNIIKDYGTEDPAKIVHVVQDLITSQSYIQANAAYLCTNRDEILKNLEVVDVSTSKDYGIVFFRYSIGSNIFREAYWVGKVENKWYWIPHLSEYSNPKPDDKMWFTTMTEKKENWEKQSAKAPF